MRQKFPFLILLRILNIFKLFEQLVSQKEADENQTGCTNKSNLVPFYTHTEYPIK